MPNSHAVAGACRGGSGDGSPARPRTSLRRGRPTARGRACGARNRRAPHRRGGRRSARTTRHRAPSGAAHRSRPWRASTSQFARSRFVTTSSGHNGGRMCESPACEPTHAGSGPSSSPTPCLPRSATSCSTASHPASSSSSRCSPSSAPPSTPSRARRSTRRRRHARRDQLLSQRSPTPRSTGLTSTTGVPSSASRAPTRSRRPSISSTVTRCRPIGFGRSASGW